MESKLKYIIPNRSLNQNSFNMKIKRDTKFPDTLLLPVSQLVNIVKRIEFILLTKCSYDQ